MLIPKASHLVERVAERLLRSGALEDSAAQLLRQSDAESAAERAANGPSNDTPARPAMAQTELPQRSSLFAPPPRAAPEPTMLAEPSGGAPPALVASGDNEGPLETHADFDPAAGYDLAHASATPVGPQAAWHVVASPASSGQPRGPGQAAAQAAVLDHGADSVASDAAAALGHGLTAALLQNSSSIDAVSLERAGMVDWSRTRSRISEEFRLVQRQIIRSAFGPGAEPGFSNLLLVTSARPGEGKSFMSTNLAGSIARQGDNHVLLIDADSKRDSICYNLGLAQAYGLLDLAADPKLDPAPFIVKTPIERLSILPVGRERERSAELFSTKEMTKLIQSLGRRYSDRLLILDAPPCLSTSDPALLAQVVGQILFVVEADRTQRDEIEASLDLIQACPTITMVLNKQQISSRFTFGAYSSYYSS
jgi:protein-tyrosine kinase